MVPGAPHEARWMRLEPRRTLPAPVVQRMVHMAFPRCRVVEMQPLAGGLRNTNLKLRLDGTPGQIVLRVYEHDASLCQKEVDLLRLVAAQVPTAEVLYASPSGFEDLPPFTLARYVEGISLLDLKRSDLKRSGDTGAIAQAAYSAGETLAAIGRATFPKAGMACCGAGRHGALAGSANPMPRFVELCLEATNLQRRMPADLRDHCRALVWSRSDELAHLSMTKRAWSTATSTGATCWYCARPGGGAWPPFWIGSSPLRALRWPTWATSCATSAPRTRSSSRISQAAIGMPAVHCRGTGGGSRDYSISPPYARA
jgi:hypothetical protein